MRHADAYGLTAVEPRDRHGARVGAHPRDPAQHRARPTTTPSASAAAGVDVLLGAARADVADDRARRRRGARGALRPAGDRQPPGDAADRRACAEAGFLTSERIFELDRAPREPRDDRRAARSRSSSRRRSTRLGVPVTVLQRGPARAARARSPSSPRGSLARLRAEGVELAARRRRRPRRASARTASKTVHAGERSWTAAEIFVGAGRHAERRGARARGGRREGRRRAASRSTAGCARASSRSTPRATSPGASCFTHSAGYEAARAVRNMFLPGSSGGAFLVPWCTFTDPELAHAGLTEAQARARARRRRRARLAPGPRRTPTAPARTPRADGELRIVTAKGRIVGAHALAPSAGELIGELALAIDRKLKLTDLASVVHVYPTIALAIQQLAGEAAYASAREVLAGSCARWRGVRRAAPSRQLSRRVVEHRPRLRRR